jgi:hypothetical protein
MRPFCQKPNPWYHLPNPWDQLPKTNFLNLTLIHHNCFYSNLALWCVNFIQPISLGKMTIGHMRQKVTQSVPFCICRKSVCKILQRQNARRQNEMSPILPDPSPKHVEYLLLFWPWCGFRRGICWRQCCPAPAVWAGQGSYPGCSSHQTPIVPWEFKRENLHLKSYCSYLFIETLRFKRRMADPTLYNF